MNRATNIKDRIIEVTTKLIEQNDIKNITARMIAEKADIGLGLINYHFGSKDNLITECVQRIIKNIVVGFHMEQDFNSDKERLTAWAIYVFDFLFEHKAISRISVLSDFQNYTSNCNSVLTQKGFMLAFKNDTSVNDKSLLAFTLTAAMQSAFLGSEAVKMLLGYDFNKSEDRTKFIKSLIDILFEKAARINE